MKIILTSLLTLFCMLLVSCSHTEPAVQPFGSRVLNNQDAPKALKIPDDVIARLDSRIASLTKGESMRIPEVLSHLGLWKYRRQLGSYRRSHVIYLGLTEDSGITFIADGGPQPITRDDVDEILSQPYKSEWDREIHKLKIWRIWYKGNNIDLVGN